MLATVARVTTVLPTFGDVGVCGLIAHRVTTPRSKAATAPAADTQTVQCASRDRSAQITDWSPVQYTARLLAFFGHHLCDGVPDAGPPCRGEAL